MTNAPAPLPPDFNPDQGAVFAHKELHTTLPAEVLWPVLIRATAWPTWYRNARRVHLPNGTDLTEKLTLRWTTFGVPVVSTVREFVHAQPNGWRGMATLSARPATTDGN